MDWQPRIAEGKKRKLAKLSFPDLWHLEGRILFLPDIKAIVPTLSQNEVHLIWFSPTISMTLVFKMYPSAPYTW